MIYSDTNNDGLSKQSKHQSPLCDTPLLHSKLFTISRKNMSEERTCCSDCCPSSSTVELGLRWEPDDVVSDASDDFSTNVLSGSAVPT